MYESQPERGERHVVDEPEQDGTGQARQDGTAEPPAEPDAEEFWLPFTRSRDWNRGAQRRDHRARGRDRRGPRLSRDEIVRAAIAVADAEGADAVSMRRIARELRAGTMSLYWHVDNKDDLLDLMLDALVGEARPQPTGDWRRDMEAGARSSRAALLRHQWVLDFIGGRPPMGPNTLRNVEHSLAVLDKLELDTATAINVLMAADTYVMGFVFRELQEVRGARRDQEQLAGLSKAEVEQIVAAYRERLSAAGGFPRLVRMIDDNVDPDAAETRDERFEFGLQCVLDGIAAQVDKSSGTASSRSRSAQKA